MKYVFHTAVLFLLIYSSASTRSKVNPIPKKSETKVNPPAVFATPQKQPAVTKNANAKSEFEEAGPGPEASSEITSNAQNAPMDIEVGPAKEQSSFQDATQPFLENARPLQENFESPNEEQPALRKLNI